MTLGDWLSAGILAVFALIGVLGGLRWVGRLVLGLAVGCVVLVALAYAPPVPVLGRVADTLDDGCVTPALLRHTDAVRDWIEWYEDTEYENDWQEGTAAAEDPADAAAP